MVKNIKTNKLEEQMDILIKEIRNKNKNATAKDQIMLIIAKCAVTIFKLLIGAVIIYILLLLLGFAHGKEYQYVTDLVKDMNRYIVPSSMIIISTILIYFFTNNNHKQTKENIVNTKEDAEEK